MVDEILMNVLSLFDGVSCGQIALNRAGIKYEKYYASEIETNAIKATKINYPDTVQLGDIEKWKDWDIDWVSIGLIMGGSPCQGFSFAGKQLAFDDPRSKLFFIFMDILNHIKKLNPKVKFLLENVYMKEEHEIVISKLTGIAPLKINSMLVSAQTRKRNYWTNFKLKQVGLFGYDEIDIPQPEDKEIYLKHVLQTDVPQKYYISETALKRILRTKYSKPKFNPQKTDAINTRNNSAHMSFDSGTTLITERGPGRSYNFDTSGKVAPLSSRLGCGYDNRIPVINNRGVIEESESGKSQCIDSNYWKGMDNHGQRTFVKEPIQLNPSKESGGMQPYQQNRVYDLSGKSPNISNDSRPPAILEKQQSLFIPEATKKGYAEIEPGDCFDIQNPNSKTRRGRKMDKKSNTIMADRNRFMHYTEEYQIRRLTPVEVCRLQTIPDDYFYKGGKQIISDSAIYKACGNGWTVDVIVHLLKHSGL